MAFQTAKSSTSSAAAATGTSQNDNQNQDQEPSPIDPSRSALLFGVFIAFVILVALLVTYGFARSRRLRILRQDDTVGGVGAAAQRPKQPRPELWDVWISDSKADIRAWAGVMPMAVSMKRVPQTEGATNEPLTPVPPAMRQYSIPMMGSMVLAPDRRYQTQTQTPRISPPPPPPPPSDDRSIWERFLFIPRRPAPPPPPQPATDESGNEVQSLQVAFVVVMPTPRPSAKELELELACHEDSQGRYYDQYALAVASVVPVGGLT